MKLRKFLSVSVLAVAVGCGGSSSKSNNTNTTPTPVANATQGSGATAGSTQAATLARTSTSSLGNVAAMNPRMQGAARLQRAAPLASRFSPMLAAQQRALALPKAKLAAALRAPTTIPSTSAPCTDGGTVTMSGTVDDATGAFTLTLVFANCREGDELTTGTATATGSSTATSDTFTMKLGTGDGSVTDTSVFTVGLFSGTNLYATYKADLTMTGTETCSDTSCTSGTSTLTANGKEIFNDFFSTATLEYRNLSMSGTDTATTLTVTLNGGISESWTEGSGASAVAHTATFTFTTFSDKLTFGSGYLEEEINGTVTSSFTPASDSCFGGRFQIVTNVPIRYNTTTGATTAGKLTINGTVVVEYKPDGSVVITVGTTAPVTYSSADALENVCQVQDTAPADTAATDVTGTTTTTGSSLLATLTWSGTGCPTTGCTSDMDLHLAHYASTAPTANSTTDWHVYYAAMSDGGAAVLDFDDTQGDGPEHITMTTLPNGYYKLYVDPFSMDQDTTATIYVSLQIGRSAYTFPTHTFNASDTAIHRVCDFVVNNGAVTIRQPDVALTTYAPALRAPKVR